MKKILTVILIIMAIVPMAAQKWTATWATAPMNTVESNMPPVSLTGKSIRQIVHVSCGGDSVRLHLSNEYSDTPVRISSIYIADALDSCDIVRKSSKYVTFKHKLNIMIDGGKAICSDAIAYKLRPLQRLTITINYDEVPEKLTSHPGSRTTSYIVSGNTKSNSKFTNCWKTDHWFNITAIDVKTSSEVKTFAILGNSITDGRGSTTNNQDRWTDRFSEALGASYGVLNLGIGGNCVDQFGLGDPGIKRYDRDILEQTNIDAVIIFEGVNDIGNAKWDPEHKWVKTSEQTVADLIKAYTEMTDKAHKLGKEVYLATITPFEGHYYYDAFHEAARQAVNKWIREQKIANGVIDFDAITRNPDKPSRLIQEYTEDWLHLTAEGYKVMGKYAANIVLNKK